MALPALTLVTNNSHTPPHSGPSTEDKAVLVEYISDLKKRGFCKMDNSASNQTQLFNCHIGIPLPLSFIENDFDRWLHRMDKECEFRSVRYITKTLEHVIGFKFVPKPVDYYTDPLSGCTWVNTFRTYKPTITDSDVSPLLLEFFERLAPDSAERHTLLQWIAHIFQAPHERPSWHIMIPSVTGTGKGYLVERILQPLLCHTSVIASYAKVLGKHSTLLEDNLLVLLDDCKAKTDSTQTELKSLLTEERQYIERKGLQGGMVQCYTRFILASNEARPLYLDPDERRWYVLSRVEHRESLQETQEFISHLDAWLNLPGSLCRVYNFFRSYSLEGFNYKSVPLGTGLQAVISMSQNPHEAFFMEFIAENKVFTFTELMQAYLDEGMSKPTDRHAHHLITKAGLEGSRPRINGQQTKLYHPAGMTLEEIRAARTTSEF